VCYRRSTCRAWRRHCEGTNVKLDNGVVGLGGKGAGPDAVPRHRVAIDASIVHGVRRPGAVGVDVVDAPNEIHGRREHRGNFGCHNDALRRGGHGRRVQHVVDCGSGGGNRGTVNCAGGAEIIGDGKVKDFSETAIPCLNAERRDAGNPARIKRKRKHISQCYAGAVNLGLVVLCVTGPGADKMETIRERIAQAVSAGAKETCGAGAGMRRRIAGGDQVAAARAGERDVAHYDVPISREVDEQFARFRDVARRSAAQFAIGVSVGVGLERRFVALVTRTP
jgi:hypothetical protein